MTRDGNDVNISNSERAQIANKAGADLFIRVHADGSADSGVSGISTLYPGKNQWTGPIVAESTEAAQAIQDGMIATTGASSKGIVATGRHHRLQLGGSPGGAGRMRIHE